MQITIDDRERIVEIVDVDMQELTRQLSKASYVDFATTGFPDSLSKDLIMLLRKLGYYQVGEPEVLGGSQIKVEFLN